jgi:hypothetical protein
MIGTDCSRWSTSEILAVIQVALRVNNEDGEDSDVNEELNAHGGGMACVGLG